MKNYIKIAPIAVKDKNDVVNALTILEKIGIKIMSEERKKIYLADTEKVVENNFLIQEDDGGFRVQSHYLGFGVPLESLEKQVDNIIKMYPDICEMLIEINDKKIELTEKIDILNKEFGAVENSFSVIEIKEN